MYIFKNIPILLDPWEKDYGIKEITNIWSSTLITYYLGSWICPLILLFTYPPFFKNVGYFINEPNKIVIISHLFSNPFFLMIVLGNLFVISVFLYTLFLLKNNIDERKFERKKEIKKIIETIALQESVSNQELSKLSLLKLEYEQIEKIPSISIPFEFYLTIIYAIINIIVIIRGLF
jgi:hypothetical protein